MPRGKSKSPPKRRPVPKKKAGQTPVAPEPAREPTQDGQNLPDGSEPSLDGMKDTQLTVDSDNQQADPRDELVRAAQEREMQREAEFEMERLRELEGAKGALAKRTKVLEPPRQEIPTEILGWAKEYIVPTLSANESGKTLDPRGRVALDKRLVKAEVDHVEKSVFQHDFTGAASHIRLTERALGMAKQNLVDGGEGKFVKSAMKYVREDVVETMKELEVSDVLEKLRHEKKLMENAYAFVDRPGSGEGTVPTRQDKNKFVNAYEKYKRCVDNLSPKTERTAEGRYFIESYTSYLEEVEQKAFNFIAERSIEEVDKHKELLGSCFVYGKTASAVKAYERFKQTLENHKALLMRADVGREYLEKLRDFMLLRQDMINTVRLDYVKKEIEREKVEVEAAIEKERKKELNEIVARNYILSLLKNYIKEIHKHEMHLRDSKSGNEYLKEARAYAQAVRDRYRAVQLHDKDETSDTYAGLQIDGMLRHIDANSPSFEDDAKGGDMLLELLSPKKKWERRRSQILALAETAVDKQRKRDRMAVTKKVERSDGQERRDAVDWNQIKPK